MVHRDERVVDVRVIVVAGSRPLRGAETARTRDLEAALRIPGEVVAEEDSPHSGSVELFVTRAEVRCERRLGELVRHPVGGRGARSDTEPCEPPAVEHGAEIAIIGRAVLDRRVLAPDDEWDPKARRDREWDVEQRHVHRERRHPEALERGPRERPLDTRADAVVDVVDAERDEVVEVRAAELGATRRSPRNGQRNETVLEALHDLPRAVLAAADGDDAVVSAT